MSLISHGALMTTFKYIFIASHSVIFVLTSF
jgi:hypothetical protein